MKNKNIILNYEERVQVALRNVVRDVLLGVAENGLPGRHHFYIAFATDHPGVDIPDYLKEQYPEEITIVLQHEFWDLIVESNRFLVTLSFDDSNERLSIPFDAILSFVDPSVKFGLQFTPEYDDFDDVEAPKSTSKPSATEKEISESTGEPTSNVITLDMFRKK